MLLAGWSGNVQPQRKITGLSRQILFAWIPIQTQDLHGFIRPPEASTICFDGKRVATASADRTLAVWDVASGTELLRLTGHTAPIFSVKFSPDGKRLVSGAWDRTVRIWNADTGTPLLTLGEMQGPILSVALSWDGKRIAAGGGIYGYPERSFDATVWDSSFELNEKR